MAALYHNCANVILVDPLITWKKLFYFSGCSTFKQCGLIYPIFSFSSPYFLCACPSLFLMSAAAGARFSTFFCKNHVHSSKTRRDHVFLTFWPFPAHSVWNSICLWHDSSFHILHCNYLHWNSRVAVQRRFHVFDNTSKFFQYSWK